MNDVKVTLAYKMLYRITEPDLSFIKRLINEEFIMANGYANKYVFRLTESFKDTEYHRIGIEYSTTNLGVRINFCIGFDNKDSIIKIKKKWREFLKYISLINKHNFD